jgi:hypothetical protein
MDLDQDGERDLIIGSNAGTYGFGLDGSELVDGDMNPATFGRLADPLGEGIGLVLVEDGAWQLVQQGLDLGLVYSEFLQPGSPVVIRGEPVPDALSAGHFALLDRAGIFAGYERDGVTRKVSWETMPGSGQSTVAIREDLTAPDGFASSPTVLAELAGLGAVAIWIDSEGQAVAGPAEAQRSGFTAPGPRSSLIAAPTHRDGSGMVVAFATKDALYVLDANLSILPGFPARVRGNLAVPPEPRLVEPIAVDLDGDDRIEFIWIDAAGGIHATNLEGREVYGWPVQGPATPVSPPTLGQFDDDSALEMAVAGRFERLVSASDEEPGFISRPVGDLRIYELSAPATAYAPWGQGLGGVTNRALQPVVPEPAAGTGLVDDSFSVRPNPATGDVVRLRAEVAGDVSARLDIYTLEGERVLSPGPFPVPAGTALDVEFRIDQLGSGTYICQLTSGGAVQRRILAVVR